MTEYEGIGVTEQGPETEPWESNPFGERLSVSKDARSDRGKDSPPTLREGETRREGEREQDQRRWIPRLLESPRQGDEAHAGSGSSGCTFLKNSSHGRHRISPFLRRSAPR